MAAYLVFWAVAIPAAIAMLQRALVVRPETADDPARRILRERYARGEIDTEEYRRRAEALDEP
jgi:putative membrane protein